MLLKKGIKMCELSTKLRSGFSFTGKHFKGRVEVLNFDTAKNTLRVQLTADNGSSFSSWNEDWNLQHVVWGLEDGEYFEKEFPANWPPTYY